MTALDDATVTGGAAYLAMDGERSGILVLDGTGEVNLGKALREGAPASAAATIEGWFNVKEWAENAVLFEQK